MEVVGTKIKQDEVPKCIRVESQKLFLSNKLQPSQLPLFFTLTKRRRVLAL